MAPPKHGLFRIEVVMEQYYGGVPINLRWAEQRDWDALLETLVELGFTDDRNTCSQPAADSVGL